MNQLINAALDARWSNLQENAKFITPDKSSGSPFSITSISNSLVKIKTDGGTSIDINRQAFVAALDYLAQGLYTAQKPCKIGSDKDITKAGPLCVATRNANGKNVMIINYLLPLLKVMGLVEIDGTRPNTTWLQ